MTSQFGIAIDNKVSAILTYLFNSYSLPKILRMEEFPPVIFIVARAWLHNFSYIASHIAMLNALRWIFKKFIKWKSSATLQISDLMHRGIDNV